MGYNEIKNELEAWGCDCPITFETPDGEFGIIENGANDLGKFFKVSIAQSNDCLRIEFYYEDGTFEVIFEN